MQTCRARRHKVHSNASSHSPIAVTARGGCIELSGLTAPCGLCSCLACVGCGGVGVAARGWPAGGGARLHCRQAGRASGARGLLFVQRGWQDDAVVWAVRATAVQVEWVPGAFEPRTPSPAPSPEHGSRHSRADIGHARQLELTKKCCLGTGGAGGRRVALLRRGAVRGRVSKRVCNLALPRARLAPPARHRARVCDEEDVMLPVHRTRAARVVPGCQAPAPFSSPPELSPHPHPPALTTPSARSPWPRMPSTSPRPRRRTPQRASRRRGRRARGSWLRRGGRRARRGWDGDRRLRAPRPTGPATGVGVGTRSC